MFTDMGLEGFLKGEMGKEKCVANPIAADQFSGHLPIFFCAASPVANLFGVISIISSPS
jgi:hypothetical protein